MNGGGGEYNGFSTNVVVSTSTTLTAGSATQELISASSVTLTLPAAATCPGKVFQITNSALVSENLVTTTGTDRILNNLGTTVSIAPGESIAIINLNKFASGAWAIVTDVPSPGVSAPAANMLATTGAGTDNAEMQLQYGGLVGSQYLSVDTTLTTGSGSQVIIVSPGVHLTLPASLDCPGKIFQIFNAPDVGETIVQCVGSDSFGFDLSTSLSLAKGESVSLLSTGAGLWIIQRDSALPAPYAIANNMIVSTSAGLVNPEMTYQFGGILGVGVNPSSNSLDASSGTLQILASGASLALPLSSTCPGKVFIVTIGNGADPSTLTTTSPDEIVPTAGNEGTTYTMLPGHTVMIQSISLEVGSIWVVLFDAPQVIDNSGTPTVAPYVLGAGASATASITGSDYAGTISLTTSSSDTPAAGHPLLAVTFNGTPLPFQTTPSVVIIPSNSAAWNLAYGSVQYLQANTTTTGFELDTPTVALPSADATYTWTYAVTR